MIQSFPCYVLVENRFGEKRQHVVEASLVSLFEHHGNIHFDMQIFPPFVQCSTEGNVDFSEQQRPLALIVNLKLHFSFFGFS